MQPNSNAPARAITGATFEILDDAIPQRLHQQAASATCEGSGWRFGHGSRDDAPTRFWKMDLDADPIFDEIWQCLRTRCEALAGTKLRVLRQYANGHTYGLGGAAHTDDNRPGTYTLLYYPITEWRDEWEGETIFYGTKGGLATAVPLRANRAVFFDSRILHAGRPPSKLCPALRVSVAYKLEAVTPGSEDTKKTQVVEISQDGVNAQNAAVVEISRDGSKRLYGIRIPQEKVDGLVDERLAALGRSIRMPGFRPGEAPRALLDERYGVQTRQEVFRLLAADVVARDLPTGSVASACRLVAGQESGDLQLEVEATHLPHLPDVDFSAAPISHLSLPDGVEPPPEAAEFLRNYVKSQVLDRLDTYSIPLFPGIVEREFASVWKVIKGQPGVTEAQIRGIAERRLRLGLIVTEMARRLGIHAQYGAELEDKVVAHFTTQARAEERRVDLEELHEMMRN
jgi:hypothetical protein